MLKGKFLHDNDQSSLTSRKIVTQTVEISQELFLEMQEDLLD